MKKLRIIYIMLSFVLGSILVQAEQISSPINYNPSRMGVFSYFKVKDDLALPGGLNTTTLNLRSADKRLTSNNKLLKVAVISTAVTRKADIDFPYAVLGGNADASVTNYSYTNAPGSGVDGVVRIRGGVLKALAGSSFISSLVTEENSSLPVGIKMYANNLVTPNIVAQGNSGRLTDIIGSENSSSDSSKGLKLGNYDIDFPPTGYTYQWLDMQFKSKQAKVLTLVRTGSSSGSGESEEPKEPKRFLTAFIHCSSFAYDTCNYNNGPSGICFSNKDLAQPRPNYALLGLIDFDSYPQYPRTDSYYEEAIGISPIPAGCTPGAECPACVPGKRYVAAAEMRRPPVCGITRDGWSIAVECLHPWAECYDTDEDSYIPVVDAVSSCSTWSQAHGADDFWY